jgi:Protein of unknown function (DUF2442)
MSAPYDIVAVEHLGGYRHRLSFADGLVSEIDPSSRLDGRGPRFEPLKDQRFFAQVRVDAELGTIVWPNGADLAPDALHARPPAEATNSGMESGGAPASSAHLPFPFTAPTAGTG